MPQVVPAQVAAALKEVFAEADRYFDESPDRLRSRPDCPAGWSVAEHLEHLRLVNHFLLLTIGKGCQKALKRAVRQPIPEFESDLTALAPIADPAAFEWLPPKHMLPGPVGDLWELRAALYSQLGHCLELLESIREGEGRLCTISMSVHRLGRLDMYQWLYFLAQHVRYHLNLLDRRRREDEAPRRGRETRAPSWGRRT
ncbi:hypothetical protein GMST_06380 [Geomonas silvestris]|uniref:DinB-like domain-containing protein n=1 Tax=Geomonas silvestris TaxID=2740184 RepID=A0A6V8MER8_9BACT|nr:DinB family protein [Geomonas silvestris]GFO58313.1 hypothetical protein GMST_06380 [Geomonas silvestris]